MKGKFWTGVLTGLSGSIIIILLCLTVYANWDWISEAKNNVGSESKVISKAEVDNKIRTIESLIDMYFIEEVEKETLVEGMYDGMMASLDDIYADYYTKEEFEELMETTNGEYCGIGAYVSQNMKTGVITIVKPFVDGPAYKAGLLPGDIIYKVNGKEVTDKDLTAVTKDMKGKAGTKASISVIREGEDKPLNFQIVRKMLESPTVEYEMLSGKLGYIAVSSFEMVTAKQFRKAVDTLDKQGAKGLVIDLRNNGGGVLDTATDMLDRILPKELLVYEENRFGEKKEHMGEDNSEYKKPIAILMNGESASASEVFAGALQDYDAAALVGTTSFGKGIVQSVIPLKDESAIKLTVAKYFTPKGRNIHGTGLTPDVEVELKKDLKKKVVITKAEDNQLQEAIKVLKEEIAK